MATDPVVASVLAVLFVGYFAVLQSMAGPLAERWADKRLRWPWRRDRTVAVLAAVALTFVGITVSPSPATARPAAHRR